MKLAIISLEDEPEVRQAVIRDLQEFAIAVRIEPAEDVQDAWDVVDEIEADGDVVALVLADHRLPGDTGVDFLIQMADDERTAGATKVLLTGQADHKDTIRAVNQAHLDYYLSKPWEPNQLQEVVRQGLTDFVLNMGIDPVDFVAVLNTEQLGSALSGRAD